MAKRNRPHTPLREQRIAMEIVVDCHTDDEIALGCYNSLESHLTFPFTARCTAPREMSPLGADDDVAVVGMASVGECRAVIFVLTPWERRKRTFPLAQLTPVRADRQRIEIIDNWHSWAGCRTRTIRATP